MADKELVKHRAALAHITKALDVFMPRIKAICAQQIRPQLVANVFLNLLSTDMKLAMCTPQSLLGALLKCAQYGMTPDKNGNRIHLIPYAGKATVQFGYKGLKELAERHPAVRVVLPPEAVYEKDDYDIELGANPRLMHKPLPSPERGKIIAFYAVADLADGAPRVFKWMWRHEVEDIRDRYSQAWQRKGKDSAWGTDFRAMGNKTVLIALCNQLPALPELAEAVGLQQRADYGIPQEIDVLDIAVSDRKAVTESMVMPEPTKDQTADQVLAEELSKPEPNKVGTAADYKPPWLQDKTTKLADKPTIPAEHVQVEAAPPPASEPELNPNEPIGSGSDLYKLLRFDFDGLTPVQKQVFRKAVGITLITDLAKWRPVPAAKAHERLRAMLADKETPK
jgi:recombination protein RecT